jgi:hypothetical protein
MYCPLVPTVPQVPITPLLDNSLIHSQDHYNKHMVFQENGINYITKKNPFLFSLMNQNNIHLVNELNRIEHEIIEYYKEFFKVNKVNVYSLRNQLKTGNIKVIQKVPIAPSGSPPKPSENSSNQDILVIKISGIWETEMNVGITFKFQI